MHVKFTSSALLIVLFIGTSCTTTRILESSDMESFSAGADSVVARMPDYTASLQTISGSGRAIISEPGNTERVSVDFSGNRQKSLIKVRNSLGIEGAEILSTGDSLLIYNKVDKIAERTSVWEDGVMSVSRLASINILDMMNVTVNPANVDSVFSSEAGYLLTLGNNSKVYVDRDGFHVLQVDRPINSGFPYSRIVYEAYAEIEEYILPRRVTIFSSDNSTKIVLLIQSLDINPEQPDLEIELPDDIIFVSQ